ncbi:toprim domain-containing protein [Rubrivivax gelatinosus]|uniref:Toprim domain-containing protein n=1 Tax=Rubrivivax gelatinosus TaxID=28068 RepID=A0A4R2ME77_RUBGE|nr:toprim domain-containing protein [Rubrivivax gelatinosus]MBK1686224.1 bifunctional DNA primase/helicase [Rubrivivax gelatinosus]TCP05719.1 Toprim domain-containing protein [Rubrivivax gelatinosus]
MSPDLLKAVLEELGEFGFKEEGSGKERWLRKGTCPSCGKRELWAIGNAPWVVKCARLNNCGYEAHVKDLYPHLFSDWSKRAKDRAAANPSEPPNPRAAADLYMSEGRGFQLALINGWYTQEHYWDDEADNGRGAGSATVRFAVGDTYWQRIIDRPERFGKKKAHFKAGSSYRGQWWQPPGMLPAECREIWIVEGIFDAIAHFHHAVPAVAALSCNNYPEKALAELRIAAAARGVEPPTLVWALDGDAAGRAYTLKHVERARKEGWTCEAAQIPQSGRGKLDWNDMHQRGRLEAKDLEEYRYHGALLIAESASAKGLLMYRHSGGARPEFDFDFRRRLYWFKLDVEAFNRAFQQLEKDDEGKRSEEELREEALKKSHTIRPIANCFPVPLYFQENKLTDESWYYFRVEFPHDAAPVKNTFSAAQLSAAAEFKKRLLGIAPGAVFSGTSQMLERMMERQLYAIKRVETVDFIGYSATHGAYVLGDVAVQGGQVHEINAEDFFDLGNKLALKSLNQSVALSINRDAQDYRADWLGLLWRCFGAKGLAALTFWFGALFAEQIRGSQKSYPFLEVVGEAGAGKSTLIEFLWKLVGRRDYEGFDPSKSSLAARARNFAQVSNLPVVLIESDRERTGDNPHVKSFDWDELKTCFNGRSVRARGMATGGNETYEPPFRGAIVISQNNQVAASDAILQRIVHLDFDRKGQTPATREAAITLESMPVEQVSGFVLRAATAEAQVLAKVAERTPVHEAHLQTLVKSTRIAKNHAQMKALADALCLVAPITDEQLAALQAQIDTMAVQRQAAISADHPMVAEFWEVFEYLENFQALNHARDEDVIAVNLNHVYEVAREHGQTLPPLGDVKKVLKTSRSRLYVDSKNVNSGLRARGENVAAVLFCHRFLKPGVKPTGKH